MKNYFFILLILLLCNCSNDSYNNSNPNIPNYNFTIDINTDLPTYNNLKFVSNGMYIPNAGARGIIVFNTTGTAYVAYDAACPNQALSACSTMVVNGITAKCNCDNFEYNLFTGQCPGKEFPMKPYRVETIGAIIRVYN
jgi:nitrite reductase/ring-hydroxylating ferredoxin subunit